MYELRVAEGKLARQLDSGETLKLSYEPDVDFDSSLDSDDISEIANELNIPEDDVESALEYGTPNSANPEFDGWVIESDDTAVYYEAKSGEISRRDIEPKLVRFRGIQRARSDIGQSEFRLNSLGPKSNSNVNGTSWDELNDRDSTDATQFDW